MCYQDHRNFKIIFGNDPKIFGTWTHRISRSQVVPNEKLEMVYTVMQKIITSQSKEMKQ